jgi:hypothetical protein
MIPTTRAEARQSEFIQSQESDAPAVSQAFCQETATDWYQWQHPLECAEGVIAFPERFKLTYQGGQWYVSAIVKTIPNLQYHSFLIPLEFYLRSQQEFQELTVRG